MIPTRLAAIPLALVVAVGLAACSSSGIEIMGVIGDTDSNRLQLSLDSCNQNPEASVEETDSEVRIEVTGDPDTGEDCADGIAVTLDSPLGERKVIDESTGGEVEVSPVLK